ncbi:DUF4179 domain-containing protein [Cohnella fermenti]|uniref:DUF4179 domain-containing protein n=1 Tax=Cohnella fermenti TaxID=2565925 RepID=A0A4S4BPT6_9BACL|nr:DUF4179 domain-containing protein [Cohnella fermenti]THF76915.1 DUF4179 domain-containing protein [Cohnella fermenti]
MPKEEKEELGRIEETGSAEELQRGKASDAKSSLDARMGEAIRAGIEAGVAERARRRRRSAKRWITLASACMLMLVCLFSIRVSPVFAAMLRDIPGLERFVELIENGDRGIRLAVENDDYQSIGATDEIDGMSVTVQGILVDESRMVIFYEWRNRADQTPLEMGDVWLEDEQGEKLSVGYGYGRGDPVREDGNNIVSGNIDVWQNSNDSRWPEHVTLHMRLHLKPEDQGMTNVEEAGEESRTETGEELLFQVGFPIDPATYVDKKRVIPIKETISPQNQSITFEKAVISPLRVAVYLSFDPANTMQVFDPGDMRLVDDQGEEWKSTGGWNDTDQPILFFESNYYRTPKSLTLEGSWFRALDKSKLDVQIDLDALRIVQAPDDKLSMGGVKRTSEGVKLTLALKGIAADDMMSYSFFDSGYTDASGAAFSFDASGGWTNNVDGQAGSEQGMYFMLEDKPYVQPLTFKLFTYPSYLRQEYRLRLW